MKNVSWASRAGCCWGWKRVSKFQKDDSTHRLVGISSKPMRVSMFRISVRTFNNGCKWPPCRPAPRAVRLYSLKVSAFHLSPFNMSAVRSVASFLISVLNSSVFSTLKLVIFFSTIIFRFFKSSTVLPNAPLTASTSPPNSWILASCCFKMSCASVTLAVTMGGFWLRSISSHLFCIALPIPILATSAPTWASKPSVVMPDAPRTACRTWNSGDPFSMQLVPSSVSTHDLFSLGTVVTYPRDCNDLMAPTTLSWVHPSFWETSRESGIPPSRPMYAASSCWSMMQASAMGG
mmetsp:Transcript_9372/g.20507  ORF Transcript_9372/g.20507 Transcript_9372/m.20507 type:complete len:291 (+) Transcript_9372:871-1743(+)